MIGIAALTIAALVFCTILITVFVQDVSTRLTNWFMRRRAIRKGVLPGEFQPHTKPPAWREPLPFEAWKPCPHCGHLDNHPMREPRKDFDNKLAATIRICNYCGHVWGEK